MTVLSASLVETPALSHDSLRLPTMITGDINADARLLYNISIDFEAWLAKLPSKVIRSSEEQKLVDKAFIRCREYRKAFIVKHTHQVYADITSDRPDHISVTELSYLAAQCFPGLTPTPAQMVAEEALTLSEKEGREIDQGIFINGLLNSPQIGPLLMARMRLPTNKAIELLATFVSSGKILLDSVHLERHGAAAHLTITNIHCLNAEDNCLVDDLETAVDLMLLDPEIKVGILRGGLMTHPRYAGRRVFSAGINLKELKAGKISYTGFLLRRELGFIEKMARGLFFSQEPVNYRPSVIEKPWIAAVDSFAIGGGAQILLVCDRVIACTGSYFALPAAREGIVPGLANLRLGSLAGGRLARQIILFGRKVFAEEKASDFVFDEVVTAENMTQSIDDAVSILSCQATVANRRMLKLAEEPLEALRLYLAEFALEQAQRLYSNDVVQNLDPA